MYNPNEAIKLLNRALEAKHPRDCLSCIHSALAILEPEPTELTTLARRFLPPKEAFEQVDITDVSEQPGQLELICHKLCKEIDRLTAELKTKDKALQNIIDESGKVDKSNWPRQQQLCQVIAQKALKGE